jgi:hypothetical protein
MKIIVMQFSPWSIFLHFSCEYLTKNVY